MKTLTRALFACFVLAAPACFAQIEVGSATLNGTVSDPAGGIVPGATVRITSSETGFTRQTSTTSAGLYNFIRVPVGTYAIAIDQAGFKGYRQDGIRLDVGAISTIDVTLQVGQQTETVTVSGESPVVETSRSSASTTVSQRAVADLPINGRNFIDFTTLTPGVVRDASRGGDLSFAGQRGPANTLLVDGADSNNIFFGQATGRTGFRPYAFSQDAVQEFQVNSNDYPAEIGRAGGGAINMVTKSGTNSFHGSAFEFYRDKGMNANTWENNRVGRAKSPYHFNQFGGSLGGPVRHDKLFFFGNYDGQRNKSTQIVAPVIPVPANALSALSKYLAPYALQLNNNVFLAKMDWNVSATDHLTVRYNASRYNGVNFESSGTSSAAEHTGDNQVTTDNVAANYTKVIGTSIVYDGRVNFVRDNEPGFATATGPEVIITNGITFGKNNFSPRYTNIRGYQTIHTLSWVTGKHSLKAGMDLNFERVDNFFPGLFAGQYQFANYDAFLSGTPTSFTQAFSGASTAPPVSHPNVNEYAFFVQDSWRATSRLTLNLGARYDFFGYKQPATRNTDAGLAAMGLRTDQFPTDATNISPRIGLAYKPGASDRMVIRGGYGIFYSRTPGLILSTAILQNGIDVRNYTLTGAAIPVYPNVFSAPPATGQQGLNIYVADPNFKTARTQQYSGQFETAIGADYTLTVGYLGVHANHLARTRDLNLLPVDTVTGTIAGGSAVTFFRHPGVSSPTRPNPAFARISLFESAADSRYNGVFIQLAKRFTHDFQLLTSYTAAKVTDNAPDATAVVPGSDDAKLAQDTLQPNLDAGPGQADIRHRFVFSAVWDMNVARNASSPVLRAVVNHWQLSTIAQVQSGRHFTATVTGDPNNDGNSSTDRVPGATRNAIEGPSLAQLDLRITRDFALGTERLKLRLLGEAFNVTNRANFNSIATAQYSYSNATRVFTPTTNFLYPLSTFDATTGAFPPRIFQLAAKIIF